MANTSTIDQAPSTAAPLLFISHKQKDSAIASAIGRFVESRTGGNVRTYQSSRFIAEGPRPGRSLSNELRRAVAEASVVVLVYTFPDEDWNYCMWECGIASDPASPEARIVVLQCSDEVPVLFTDQVRVKARDLVDVQRFTEELLTAPDFFPGFPGPAPTKFEPRSQQVMEAAADLHRELLQVLPIVPPTAADWASFPFLRLELDGVAAMALGPDVSSDDRLKTFTETCAVRCRVLADDKAGEQIFGIADCTGRSLTEIVDSWRSSHANASLAWIESAYRQLGDSASKRLPLPDWEVLFDRTGSVPHAPIVVHVQPPSRSNASFRFDMYFVPLAGPRAKTIEIKALSAEPALGSPALNSA